MDNKLIQNSNARAAEIIENVLIFSENFVAIISAGAMIEKREGLSEGISLVEVEFKLVRGKRRKY